MNDRLAEQDFAVFKLLICTTPRGTRSSSVVTFSRPPTSLKITNRLFHHASPHAWNQLRVSFRQPCINHCWWRHTL